MNYSTLVWDWNGTLLDDVDLALSVANDLFADLGVAAVSRERYLQIFDFPVQLYYERAGVDFGAVDFAVISARYCDVFERRLDEAGLFDAASATLERLRTMGVVQFVLSSTEQKTLERMVERFALQDNFIALHGLPDGLARGKVAAGEALITRHAIDPQRTLMVGDTRHDLEVAQALGFDCVLIATGHQSKERLQAGGVRVLNTLDELVPYLQQP